MSAICLSQTYHMLHMWYANNNSKEAELEILIKLAWKQRICSICTEVLFKYNADIHRTEAIMFLVGFRRRHAIYFSILGRNGKHIVNLQPKVPITVMRRDAFSL